MELSGRSWKLSGPCFMGSPMEATNFQVVVIWTWKQKCRTLQTIYIFRSTHPFGTYNIKRGEPETWKFGFSKKSKHCTGAPLPNGWALSKQIQASLHQHTSPSIRSRIHESSLVATVKYLLDFRSCLLQTGSKVGKYCAFLSLRVSLKIPTLSGAAFEFIKPHGIVFMYTPPWWTSRDGDGTTNTLTSTYTSRTRIRHRQFGREFPESLLSKIPNFLVSISRLPDFWQARGQEV